MISERCDLFFIFFKMHSISNKEVSIERALYVEGMVGWWVICYD